MDLKQLRYFTAIVEEGSISKAADSLFMTQPPLSKQMANLESELGCELFKRGARNIQLTEEGKLLYKKALEMLEMKEVITDSIKNLKAEKETLRIGIVSSVVNTSSVDLLSSFMRQYPNVDLELFEQDTYALLERLERGSIQAAVLRSPYQSVPYACVNLYSEEIIAYGSDREEMSLDELSQLSLITYRRWLPILKDSFAAHKLNAGFRLVVDNARTAINYADNESGVALVPLSAVQQKQKAARIKGVSLVSEVNLLYNPDAYLPNCARLFIEYITHYYRNSSHSLAV